jgi:hypothetical protein
MPENEKSKSRVYVDAVTFTIDIECAVGRGVLTPGRRNIHPVSFTLNNALNKLYAVAAPCAGAWVTPEVIDAASRLGSEVYTCYDVHQMILSHAKALPSRRDYEHLFANDSMLSTLLGRCTDATTSLRAKRRVAKAWVDETFYGGDGLRQRMCTAAMTRLLAPFNCKFAYQTPAQHDVLEDTILLKWMDISTINQHYQDTSMLPVLVRKGARGWTPVKARTHNGSRNMYEGLLVDYEAYASKRTRQNDYLTGLSPYEVKSRHGFYRSKRRVEAVAQFLEAAADILNGKARGFKPAHLKARRYPVEVPR